MAVVQSLRQEVADARKEAAEQRAKSEKLEKDMDLLKKYLIPPGVLIGNEFKTDYVDNFHNPIYTEDIHNFHMSWPSLAVHETYKWIQKRTESDQHNARVSW